MSMNNVWSTLEQVGSSPESLFIQINDIKHFCFALTGLTESEKLHCITTIGFKINHAQRKGFVTAQNLEEQC